MPSAEKFIRRVDDLYTVWDIIFINVYIYREWGCWWWATYIWNESQLDEEKYTILPYTHIL